jgi:hypothetical protein
VFLSVFVIAIDTEGRMAPLPSRTVPVNVAVDVCAPLFAGDRTVRTKTNKTRNPRLRMNAPF